MQAYEIATLSTTLGAAGKAGPAIEAFAAQDGAAGRLLGVFATEIGELNKILVLRGFATQADLETERARTLSSSNPFGAAEWLTGLTLERYAPFPFLPPVEPGAYGKVYEFRTYVLKTGGLQPTLKAWEAAVPGRTALSPLTVALYGLDGPARITHIWPFESLDARGAVRADSVAKGVWPPKGGPDWLTPDMRSTIALPLPVSPLR